MSEIPIIHEHSTDLPLVEIRHILRSGTVVERPEVAGVGRIALRLLRRGAGGLDRRGLDEAIDRIASVISMQASPDFYAIHLRALERFVGRANDLLAKILLEPTLDEGELDRLKRETLAEIITSRDDDRGLASRALRRLIYRDHPYGRSPRGTLETVARITRDDVVRFLEENLVRDNVLIGAAGDIDPERLREALSQTVDRLPERPAPRGELEPAEEEPGVRVVLVDKPDRTQTQIFMGHLGPSIHDFLDLPLRVALTAFGGTFTSRLMQEVRVARGWSYGAYSSLGRGRVPEVLSLWVFPSLKDAVPCIELVRGLYTELKEKGPTDEDVLFARDFLAKSLALQKDTAPSRLTLRLRQELLGMAPDYYDTFAERVRAVTPIQVRDAVATQIKDQDLAIAITCTADQLIGPLRESLGEDASIDVIPYDSPDL